MLNDPITYMWAEKDKLHIARTHLEETESFRNVVSCYKNLVGVHFSVKLDFLFEQDRPLESFLSSHLALPRGAAAAYIIGVICYTAQCHESRVREAVPFSTQS